MTSLTTTTSDRALKPYFHPASIMAKPDTLLMLADQYFRQYQSLKARHEALNIPTENLNTEDPQDYQAPPLIPPTPASLALALGFSNVGTMTKATTNEDYPEESRNILLSAITQLEADLSEKALTDNINVPFTKFLFSSRLGISEKTEHTVSSTNTVTIEVFSPEPTSLQEFQEMNRLQQAVDEQEVLELTAMGANTDGTKYEVKRGEDEDAPAHTEQSLVKPNKPSLEELI